MGIGSLTTCFTGSGVGSVHVPWASKSWTSRRMTRTGGAVLVVGSSQRPRLHEGSGVAEGVGVGVGVTATGVGVGVAGVVGVAPPPPHAERPRRSATAENLRNGRTIETSDPKSQDDNIDGRTHLR